MDVGSDGTETALTGRIKALERRLSWSLLAVGLMAVGGTANMIGVSHEARDRTTIAAENFVLRNAKGDIVGLLGAGKDGRGSLTFYDENKDVRLLVGAKSDGSPSLAMWNAEKKIQLALAADGVSSVTLADATGHVRWSASVNETGPQIRSFGSATPREGVEAPR